MAPLPKRQLTLGERIRVLRHERTQEDLAIEVRQLTSRKLTAGAISQIETGRIRPEPATMRAIAVALGVEPNEWPEYRLAVLRESLDERVVGLDAAVHHAEVIEGALSEPALEDLGLVIARAKQDAPRSPQSVAEAG